LYIKEDFDELLRGLEASPIHEVLIDKAAGRSTGRILGDKMIM
jgi:hypothetical protein